MSKFCSNCGTQMDDNLMFCGNCGAKAADQPVAAPVAPKAAPSGGFDFLGILTGKADAKLNWLVALAFQVLSLTLFVLPIFRIRFKYFATADRPVDVDREAWSFFNERFDGTGYRVFPVILLIFALVAIGYMLLPIIMKKDLNPAAAVSVLLTQGVIYLSTLFYGIEISDSERTLYSVYNKGFSIWGWFYLIIGSVALFLIGRVVFQNIKKLI